MFRHGMGIEPPQELVGLVHQQTEGYPLFVSQVLQLLEQEGMLTVSGIDIDYPLNSLPWIMKSRRRYYPVGSHRPFSKGTARETRNSSPIPRVM